VLCVSNEMGNLAKKGGGFELAFLFTFNFLKSLLIESDQPRNQNEITSEIYTFSQLKTKNN